MDAMPRPHKAQRRIVTICKSLVGNYPVELYHVMVTFRPIRYNQSLTGLLRPDFRRFVQPAPAVPG